MSNWTVIFAVLLIMFVVLFVSTFSKSHNWAMEANKNSNFPHRIPKGIDPLTQQKISEMEVAT